MQPTETKVSPPESCNALGSAPRHRRGTPGGRRRAWLGLLGACILLSLVLHIATGRWLEFRPWEETPHDLLMWVDIVSPAPAVVPPPASALSETDLQPQPLPNRLPVRKAKKTKMKPAPIAAQTNPEHSARSTAEAVPTQATPTTDPSTPSSPQVPVGQTVAQPGVTVLANESGQDTLKHGAEARFMHGLATEEFVEENYVGAYSLGAKGRVWIEDDRAGSGHLILHAEHMGLIRPLFRYNRFIYIYGERPDAPEPILGTVTFFSDGYHIHQFLWQHNSTHAYYPRRIPE